MLAFASCQLSARGRGSNGWISPFGSIGFSLVLRVSLSQIPMPKLVFVQYLAGLAVTEACRSEEVIGEWGDGVLLKWPNDIYILSPDENGVQRKKIGGILTTTSVQGGQCSIVCGEHAPLLFFFFFLFVDVGF
jgi:biotin--protein ligase